MILNRQREVRVHLKDLDAFLAHVRRKLNLPKDSVTICLVSSAEIARLNRRYRHKPGATDVLSFPSSTSFASSTSAYLGDLAISPATARRNARRFGRSLSDELRILVLHGVLHLLGYDHETDTGRMDRVESRLRRELDLE
jgi:probable rRNA maturation factor